MKKTIGIFCSPGPLAKFITPVVDNLKKDFYIIECYDTDKETIHQTILRSDVIFIEWANELTSYITHNFKNLLNDKKVIVRLHSYEAIFNNGQLLHAINWTVVNNLICVANHVLDVVKEKLGIKLKNIDCQIIPNGVDLEKFTHKKELLNFNLNKKPPVINFGFAGHLDHKKELPLLLQAIRYFSQCNSSLKFKIHIAGNWGDERYERYIKHIIERINLEENIVFYDWVDDMNEWMEQIDFMICSSPWESQCMMIMEAMAKGIVPLVHNFPGSEDIYPAGCIWEDINRFNNIVETFIADYQSFDFRNWIKSRYNFQDTQSKLSFLLNSEVSKKEIKDNPKVGCVIAVRNGEKTIMRTLLSIWNQTYRPNKIIIVDDASTDNTINNNVLDFQKLFKYEDEDLEIIRLKENVWVPSARNIGAKELDEDTDYIFFMDADDWIEDAYVEKCINEFKANPDLTVVYTDSIYFTDANQNIKESIVNQPDFDPNRLIHHNYMHYASMQKFSSFNDHDGYSEKLSDYRNHMYDQHLWLKYILNNEIAKRIPEPLFHYCDNTDSISHNYERPRNDMHVQMISDNFEKIKQKVNIGVDKKKTKKILLVCWGRDYINKELMSWEVYTFTKALEDFGYVYSFYWDIESKYHGVDNMNKRLVDKANEIDPDLIFHICYKDIIKKETWNKLSEKYNTLGFFCDDDWRYDNYSKDYSKGFSYIVTTYGDAYEKYLLDNPKAFKNNFFLSQWGCNNYYWKDNAKNRSIDTIFFGQNYGDRINQLNNITWYGKGSPNGMIDFPEMCSLASQSKIAINFADSSRGSKYKQIKCRPFEVTGAGCLLLTEYSPGLENYFIFGKDYFNEDIKSEIITFTNINDLKDKINYFLGNNNLLNKIAKNGQERTLKNHTWKSRFEPIFNSIWS